MKALNEFIKQINLQSPFIFSVKFIVKDLKWEPAYL